MFVANVLCYYQHVRLRARSFVHTKKVKSFIHSNKLTVYICAYVPIFAVRTYDNNNSRLNERVSVCSCRRTGTNIHYQNCVDDSIFIVCDNCRRPFQVSRRKESMSESMSELSYNWFSSIL